MADSCDRAWCICDTHDFEDGQTFESEFAARQSAAVDRTVPNVEPIPVPIEESIMPNPEAKPKEIPTFVIDEPGSETLKPVTKSK